MDAYEEFVSRNRCGCFTQSKNWSNIKQGWIAERITARDINNNIVGAMQIFVKKIPMLNTAFLYSPRGAVCDYHCKEAVEAIFKEADAISQKYNAFLLKIDPQIDENDLTAIGNIKNCDFVFSDYNSEDNTVQCRSNYILPISDKSENDIFSAFHKKYRYNIRLAERKGVECKICDTSALSDFYALMLKTASRDGFNTRSKKYFEKIMKELGKQCRLYMCYYQDIPLSGAVAINYGGRVSYLYGASSDEHRCFMPNYLMQWNMIKWAIETNCHTYDFMGVPHYDDEQHPNYGVYRFKKGFGGNVVTYAGEFNKIYSPAKSKLISNLLKLTAKTYL